MANNDPSSSRAASAAAAGLTQPDDVFQPAAAFPPADVFQPAAAFPPADVFQPCNCKECRCENEYCPSFKTPEFHFQTRMYGSQMEITLRTRPTHWGFKVMGDIIKELSFLQFILVDSSQPEEIGLKTIYRATFVEDILEDDINRQIHGILRREIMPNVLGIGEGSSNPGHLASLVHDFSIRVAGENVYICIILKSENWDYIMTTHIIKSWSARMHFCSMNLTRVSGYSKAMFMAKLKTAPQPIPTEYLIWQFCFYIEKFQKWWRARVVEGLPKALGTLDLEIVVLDRNGGIYTTCSFKDLVVPDEDCFFEKLFKALVDSGFHFKETGLSWPSAQKRANKFTMSMDDKCCMSAEEIRAFLVSQIEGSSSG